VLRACEAQARRMVAAEFAPIHQEVAEWGQKVKARLSGVSKKVSRFLGHVDDEDGAEED
jgi:hypothetical protein